MRLSWMLLFDASLYFCSFNCSLQAAALARSRFSGAVSPRGGCSHCLLSGKL